MRNENIVYDTALQYISCEVFGEAFNIPYMINNSDRYCSPHTKGKAPIQAIIEEFKQKLAQDQQQNSHLSANKIKLKMQSYGIGIDCSGFAYHLLNPLVTSRTGKDLSHFLVRFPGILGILDIKIFNKKRYQKISATQLTNSSNTNRVNLISDIQVGDIIRMTHEGYEGKHPLVIVQVSPKFLVYAHSSEYVEINGAHFGKIKIIDNAKGLEKQKWLEKTITGKNYGINAFRIDSGDSIRRLKCLE